MSTPSQNVITLLAICVCCVIPRFECCNTGIRATLEERVDGSNIVVLGTVLAHYQETRPNMFTAEIQVKCVLKDTGFSVHDVVNISHAGNDSGGRCFENTLTINNTYYIFARVLTSTFWTPGAEEIPDKSSDVTQLLTTCGLFVTGPGPVNACAGLQVNPCPTTTPHPPPTRRTKTSAPTSSPQPGTTVIVVGLANPSGPGIKGTTATVVGLTNPSVPGIKDTPDKEESRDTKVGAVLGGVLGPLAAGAVGATIYFYIKIMKNKKVSDTEPQKDKIMEDDNLPETHSSKPPMIMDAIENPIVISHL